MIDADNLAPDICDAEIEYGTKPVHFSANAIDFAPTIDGVLVVRCKDCKHYKTGVCLKIYYDGLASRYAWQERKPDDFCSYGERGERKEGADNV